MYNFEMHDSLPPCSELNKNLKQVDYFMPGVQFARENLGFLLMLCLLCFLPLCKAWQMMAGK